METLKQLATVAGLRGLAERTQTLPTLWRTKLRQTVEETEVRGTRTEGSDGVKPLRWRPGGGPVEILAMQGDLTACAADAIVNPANSQLMHGGGVAGAIVKKGGQSIQEESNQWISKHVKLPVGEAMSTKAGRLPCRYVIHTVGPRIAGLGTGTPTPEEEQLLRNAVKSALTEADRLAVQSVAIPGISSGIFGYPRDLAAREIVGECVRYCRQAAKTDATKSELKTIALMNIDSPTFASFARALRESADLDGERVDPFDHDPFSPQAPTSP